MKISPIIQLLQQNLPKYTDKFTNQNTVTSGSVVNGLVSCVTSSLHGFVSGEYVVIHNAVVSVQITSIVVLNNMATIATDEDNGHNETFNFKNTFSDDINVELINFSNASLNGTFKIVSVPNRYKILATIDIADGTYTADGSLLNYASNELNGVHSVTSTGTSTFTYQVDSIINSEIYSEPTINSYIRITGSSTLKRALASYTEQDTAGAIDDGKYFLFVTHGNTTSNRDRNSVTDKNTIQVGQDYKLILNEDFDVNVFVKVNNQLSNVILRDIMEDIKIAIFKVLLRTQPPLQYVSNANYQILFDSDYEVDTDNNSYMVQAYKFITSYDVTFGDTSEIQDIAPFRDITLDLNYDTITREINLDDKQQE
jgi:hypothetical protein